MIVFVNGFLSHCLSCHVRLYSPVECVPLWSYSSHFLVIPLTAVVLRREVSSWLGFQRSIWGQEAPSSGRSDKFDWPIVDWENQSSCMKYDRVAEIYECSSDRYILLGVGTLRYFIRNGEIKIFRRILFFKLFCKEWKWKDNYCKKFTHTENLKIKWANEWERIQGVSGMIREFWNRIIRKRTQIFKNGQLIIYSK